MPNVASKLDEMRLTLQKGQGNAMYEWDNLFPKVF